MKYFEKETKCEDWHDRCAGAVLDTIPLIMQAIRAEVRRRRPQDLSLPQYRVMLFLECHAGASLTVVSEHLGFTPSSISKTIDELVHRRLVTRKTSPQDRRRAILKLTSEGKDVLATVILVSRTNLAQTLASLSEPECTALLESLTLLRDRFTLPERGEALKGAVACDAQGDE